MTTDTLKPVNRFDLNGDYGPFSFTHLQVTDSDLLMVNSASLESDAIALSGTSSLSVASTSVLSSQHITVTDNSELYYQSSYPLQIKELTLEDSAVVLGASLTQLQIEAESISLGPNTQLHVNDSGYISGPGTPPADSRLGGSHGGLARGSLVAPTYGSSTQPVDFGSGGDFGLPGGGALLLTVSDQLKNDGLISANGAPAASGGSLLINTNKLSGSGVFAANGGNFGRSAHYYGAGAGGRVAIYTNDNENWTGTSTAKGGRHVTSSGSPIVYAGDGTVFFIQNEPIDPLLLQYAPILYMHPDEDYFPMNVESFIEGSSLWSQDGLGDTLLRYEEELTVSEFENIIGSGVDTSDYYLAYSDPDNAKSIDLAGAKAKYDLSVTNGNATTTVYVYRMEDGYTDDFGVEHNFIVLQYWFFYAMNNWLEHDGFNNHEGDWESVFIFLDKATEEPEYIAYSAHHNDGNPNFISQYDSVRRDWSSEEVVFDKGQIVSFVAIGSHANYPDNGNAGVHSARTSDDITSTNGNQIEFGGGQYSTLENELLSNYKGIWGADRNDFFEESSGPSGPHHSEVSGINRFEYPVKWAGIDKVFDTTVQVADTTFDLDSQGIKMEFTKALEVGTELSSNLYEEVISFGSNLANINFLPKYWDFETSLTNDSFNVSVTIDYAREQLKAWGVDEEFLTVYLYNDIQKLWEPVQSRTDTFREEVTFDTDHFSRYTLGSSKWEDITPHVETKQHWGKYGPKTATREAVVKVKSNNPHETLRLVVTDVSATGIYLKNNDGLTVDDLRYIKLDTDANGEGEATLIFNVFPKEIIFTGNGETIYVPDQLKFEFEISIESKQVI